MAADSERAGLKPLTNIDARYEVQRTLGQGAAGIVYEVRDRETGERLALKKLLRMDLKSVLRLKHEFRALADLHHPNLVKLYDLGHADDAWFITMEHLSGTDLISYLHGPAHASGSGRRPSVANQNALPAGQLPRLCAAFMQLARGIRALHRAGMLHRDLKPSNVMVAQERVVVLDFGLVREIGETALTVTHEDTVAGTPAYMAPEQVQNSVLSGATDWYAFGVMLYEALTGLLPITGSLYELLQRKLDRDPTPIGELVPNLPKNLAKLCTALLQRDPTLRPSYDGIAEVLAAHAPTVDITTQAELSVEQLAPTRHAARTVLVGREHERALLTKTFQEAACGKLWVTHVRGPAGSGKSALVEHFLEEVAHELRPNAPADVLCLRARCYEREAMPFKALDGLLDALVNYVSRLDDLVVSHMLPTHLAELARAFPVLERLPAVKRLLRPNPARVDAALERSRAEFALQDLLRRVASHKLLVLWIDDLQWGDLDSARVIKSWLEADDTLPVFLVLSYRSDEHETNAVLKFLTQQDGRNSHMAPGFARDASRSNRPSQRARRNSGRLHVASTQPETPSPVSESIIDLAPLTAAEVRDLCVQTLSETVGDHSELVERIVSEAQGSPFLARQLLTLAQARIAQGERGVNTLSIPSLLSQVTALLSESERALLNVFAVAGRPLSPMLALRAAQIRRDGRSQLHALNGLSLTRVRVVQEQRLIEVYHHRMREAVVAALSPGERLDTHRRLLTVLEQSGRADPDWLYVVAVGAENSAAALRYGLSAAERAAESLAFERAAELYRDGIARMGESKNCSELWRKLGDVLGACGRGAAAAEAYVEAAKGAPAHLVVELLRFAATHYVRSGHFEQGEALVRQVLHGLNIKVPQSENGLIAAIVWERMTRAIGGLDFKRQENDARDSQAYRLAVVYGSFSVDTQAYDPVRAALFGARALRHALDVGAPGLVCSSLCIAATMRCVSGSKRDAAYAEDLLVRARGLAEEVNDTLMLARVQTARAVCSFLTGRIQASVELSAEADQYYKASKLSDYDLPGDYYLRATIRAMRIGALMQLGQLHRARAELRHAIQDAHATENRTAMFHLSLVIALDDMALGESERSRVRLDGERSQLPANSFGPLHLTHMVAVMRIGASLGAFAWSMAIIEDLWPRFEKSLVRHSVFSMIAYGAHARLLLNRHIVEKRAGDPHSLIRSDMRAMSKLATRVTSAMYTRFVARLAHLTDTREHAIEKCREHLELCVDGSYLEEAERARWGLGSALGGEEGEAMCRSACETLEELGVVDAALHMDGHYPEFCG
ncbi:MAG: hypothetical protein RL701_2046 [Pseudomonadota bacterium]